MADAATTPAQPKGATGVLVLADGTVVWGKGFGHVGEAVGEVCFNTAMTGYQEVMTDPSYAAQIVTFTFPHIGNVGANAEDIESNVEGAVGCIVREDVTQPSSFRAERTFEDWMKGHLKIGLSGVDTRALTRRIRLSGAPNAVIAHHPKGQFDIPALLRRVSARVSTPDRPILRCPFIQSSKVRSARKLECAVTSSRTMQPTAPSTFDSTSSGLAPTLPMCGKVKVTICAA